MGLIDFPVIVYVLYWIRYGGRSTIQVRLSLDDGKDEKRSRDEFTVKILHSSFCDTKIELRSSWCDLCSSIFCCVLEKKILELRDIFPAQPVQAILIIKKKIVLPLQR